MKGFDYVTHSVFWSMLFNIGAYIAVSLFTKPTAIEHSQAALFVDVFKHLPEDDKATIWRGTASLPDLRSLLARFLGEKAR